MLRGLGFWGVGLERLVGLPEASVHGHSPPNVSYNSARCLAGSTGVGIHFLAGRPMLDSTSILHDVLVDRQQHQHCDGCDDDCHCVPILTPDRRRAKP